MFKDFNVKLFTRLSDIMCSPICGYVVAIIITFAVCKSPPKDLLQVSTVIVQSYFQGVGLCILGYASNLSSDKITKKIDDIWSWQKESHDLMIHSHRDLHDKLDNKINKINNTDI
jgi:hypothetical protein